jgi:hypothetical protein
LNYSNFRKENRKNIKENKIEKKFLPGPAQLGVPASGAFLARALKRSIGAPVASAVVHVSAPGSVV